MVTLRKIDKHSFQDVLALSVDEAQKTFVASNLYSLAQAWLYGDDAYPFAIYAGDALVGFFMGCTEAMEDGTVEYGIWRLMIDKAHQGKGYGRMALRLAVDFLRGLGAKEVLLSYEPENDVAAKLYASEGFVLTGEVNDGELEAKLVL